MSHAKESEVQARLEEQELLQQLDLEALSPRSRALRRSNTTSEARLAD
jgi:hypothetical protein